MSHKRAESPLRGALVEGAVSLGLSLAPDHLDRFERYAGELVEWNRRVNLTAITEPVDIARKHFLDSLSVLAVLAGRAGDSLIDVGSGAGFPGLPIKLMRPDLRVTLVESARKKCEFLHYMVKTLELKGVTIVQARAEDAARDGVHRESYPVAAARAVAGLATLAEYLLPFVRVGGMAIAQKSGEVEAELAQAKAAIGVLGGCVRRSVLVKIPGLDEPRALVVIDKIAPTPDKYPRRAGMPAKRPIR